MLINTTNFGDFTVEPDQIIRFPEGLPGFEAEKEFLLLNNYDTEEPVPFMWLQAAKNPELALVVAIPFFLKKDYEFEIPKDALERLDIKVPSQVGVYTVCKITEQVSDMTLNLACPIVINADTRIGEQVILDTSAYSVSEKLEI